MKDLEIRFPLIQHYHREFAPDEAHVCTQQRVSDLWHMGAELRVMLATEPCVERNGLIDVIHSLYALAADLEEVKG